MIVLPPDLELLEQTLASRSDIAGVITEGSGASYGTVPLQSGFLEGVRNLTRQYGVVMILDEVITGFRWSPGGLQQRLGIDADLCTLAKILTGGLPGGAVAGRGDIMQVMEQTGDSEHDRYERVLHGGTFNANPYCAATGNAALEIAATGEMQNNADRMAERLRVGLREIMARYEVAATVYGESSTFHVYFGGSTIEGLDANTLKSAPPRDTERVPPGVASPRRGPHVPDQRRPFRRPHRGRHRRKSRSRRWRDQCDDRRRPVAAQLGEEWPVASW